jgi:hypothetical protein
MPFGQIKDAIHVTALIRARTYGEAQDIVDHLSRAAQRAAGRTDPSAESAAPHGAASVGAPDLSSSGT